jgi:single-strand DNA-binding protein
MYNRVFIIGNLTKDPEMRSTTAGIPVAHFSVAVNRFGPKNEVDFFNIVAWRRLAEVCGEYLKKGRPVAIEGKLQSRSYKGKDGQDRMFYEIVVDNVQMLGKREPGEAPSKNAPAKSEEEAPF